MSCKMSGLLVTMPLPRGRKSRPTMFSRTEDLPDDCEPTTTYTAVSTFVDRKSVCRSDYNLRKIERIIANGVEDKILELVDNTKQVLSK